MTEKAKKPSSNEEEDVAKEAAKPQDSSLQFTVRPHVAINANSQQKGGAIFPYICLD